MFNCVYLFELGWCNMNKLELEQNKYINTLYSIVDKLEQRISTLEKVLDSHAKCIGELRNKEHIAECIGEMREKNDRL